MFCSAGHQGFQRADQNRAWVLFCSSFVNGEEKVQYGTRVLTGRVTSCMRGELCVQHGCLLFISYACAHTALETAWLYGHPWVLPVFSFQVWFGDLNGFRS